MPDTATGKWGTHVDVADEDNERFMDFVHDGARQTIRNAGAVLLEGPCERKLVKPRREPGMLALLLWPYEKTRA